MLFSRINIKEELIRERNRQSQLLAEVKNILSVSENQDKEILKRLKQEQRSSNHAPSLDAEDAQYVFLMEEIKNVCVKYRLRFLDSSFFKSEFPYEAIASVKAFERKYETKIERFKIIAPGKMFDLEDINKDPLLLAQLSDNRFFLIHKWGKDLKWYRALKYFPLKNFFSFLVSLWILCALVTISVPNSIMNVFSFVSAAYLHIWLGLHCFIGFFGIALYVGFTYNINFSENNWKSKYYNW